jgi:hypothetical protein
VAKRPGLLVIVVVGGAGLLLAGALLSYKLAGPVGLGVFGTLAGIGLVLLGRELLYY